MIMRAPKPPPAPPPPPPPKPIPTETEPSIRQAQIEAERTGRNRRGRKSTILSGSLGDGMYDAPQTTGGRTVLG